MSWFSDYEQEVGKIKNGNLRPLYFLYGNDYYLRDSALRAIRASMTAKGIVYDYTFFNASELDASELQNVLFGSSLFQTTKCSLLSNIKSMLPSARKILIAYFKQPDPANVLVLTAEEYEGRNAFYKRIQDASTTLMCNSPYESEIPAWIQQYARGLNRTIDNQAVNELLRYAGTDLGQLSNELDKIHIYLPEDKVIEQKDIRKVSGFSKSYSLDQLLEVIGKKNKKAAIVITKNLLENDMSEVYILTVVYQYLWKLIMLKDPRLAGDPDLGKKLRVYRPQQLNGLRAAASKYTMSQLRQGISYLVEADRRVKTSSCNSLSNLMITLEGILG
ncbi:MAG: DNA polymerase III subunit delta [Candidatus Neomarinimicrobiota bacterium]